MKRGHPASRRQFLHATAAGAAMAMLPGCGHQSTEPQAPVGFAPGKPLPWINWAGNQFCNPTTLAAPETEAEVVDVLKNAKGIVRAVGAGSSFSAVVPTNDTLVSTDLLSGLIGHDEAVAQADIWAGTRMFDLGFLLDSVGQAMPNISDMNYPAMGGAIATSTHGTGKSFGSLSSCVAGLTLATPSGQLLECSATKNREIFQAARNSIGALGIVTRLKLQNQKAFNITQRNRVEKTEEVLEDLAARCAKHRHFEFMPLTNSDLCVSIATDLAGSHDVSVGEDDPESVNTLRKVFDATSWIPGGKLAYDTILSLAMGDSASTVRTGKSFEVFPNPRMVRFREMEYTVPAEAGPACLREILHTIRHKGIPVCFPLEYRYVKGDDIWLSMFEGRDGCTISIHQFGDVDFKPYFAEIEPIFWKHEGRPHWGKIHTLDAPRLAALYPRHWKDFQEVRKVLDPQGRMLNAHLHSVFGV